MLTGDRAKYFGLVFGVSFASLLMAHQMSIFSGIMRRTTSHILDVREPDIWVVRPNVKYIDELKPLTDGMLYRVRSVSGVAWAVPFYKGQVQLRYQELDAQGRPKDEDGRFRNVTLLGLDDATLIGAPVEFIEGSLEDIRQPDAIIVDSTGHHYLWPGQPFQRGRIVEINDRRAKLVALCRASPTFQSMPIIYTRLSQAKRFAPPERNQLSAILVKAQEGSTLPELARRISEQTDLLALTRDEFFWKTIQYYTENTGIIINFGITIFLGFFVGTAIAGQTFYLFVIENLKQFGSLKAMGLSNVRIVGMILLQVFLVAVMGFSVGMGLAAAFFEITKNQPQLTGFFVPWFVVALTAGAVAIIAVLASLLSIRKVLVLEPAVVFK
jgi:putative ABC transport system permease protein